MAAHLQLMIRRRATSHRSDQLSAQVTYAIRTLLNNDKAHAWQRI
jgi:hypothetical protein